MRSINITEIPGFLFGHAQNEEAATGCTVILAEEGAVAGVSVRGGAPGTRETDLLKSENLVQSVHAVFMAGGSAYGLQAGGGIMEALEARGIGFTTQAAKVPIVPGAILYDLTIGSSTVRPDSHMGRQACVNAFLNKPFTNGNYGVGTGAVVGKISGDQFAMKGGVGSFAVQVDDLQVGAVVAVNCFGDVIDPYSQRRLAGVYDRKEHTYRKTEAVLIEQMAASPSNRFSENTSLGTVVTNAALTKAQSNKLSDVAHNGFARTMIPSHTFVDGDTLFSLSTGEVEVDVNSLSFLYPYVVEQAVLKAIKAPKGSHGIIAYQDVKYE
ncbi:P1 family peptidase [Halobacillus andaensis]|uniref:P1 family peptidase n=1 Tax=Halobacillus andaensis TaxID=1176239 RepID=UPI003D723611